MKKIITGIKLLFIAVIFFGFVCIIPFILFPKNFCFLREYLNGNSIAILTDDHLDKKNVNVYWISNSGVSKKVIDKGQEIEVSYKENELNRFVVTYENDTIGCFSYYKTKSWCGHQHLIKLKKEKTGKIELDVEIFGPNKDYLDIESK